MITPYMDQTASARNAIAVTPSDTDNFINQARGLYCGGDGDVAVVTLHGSPVVFKSVLAGSILPVQCMRVNATDTTATDIIALF